MARKRTGDEIGFAWLDWKIGEEERTVRLLDDKAWHTFAHFLDGLPDPITETEFDSFKRTARLFVETNRRK